MFWNNQFPNLHIVWHWEGLAYLAVRRAEGRRAGMVGVWTTARRFLIWEITQRESIVDGFKSAFFLHPPSLAHNKSLNPFSGQIAPFPCVGQADWKHVCHSAFLQANQETLGWWDFCLSSMEPAWQSSRAEAAGPTPARGCLSSLQTDRKILLTTNLSRGFKGDLNLKCDIPHRPTWLGPTEPNPLFCSNKVHVT